jgi:hypothetical protein
MKRARWGRRFRLPIAPDVGLMASVWLLVRPMPRPNLEPPL